MLEDVHILSFHWKQRINHLDIVLQNVMMDILSLEAFGTP